MRILKALATGVMTAAILTSCAPSYRETLEQKLEGKTPDQRRAILAQECGQEIQKGIKPENEANVRHFEKMKKICEEMTSKPVVVKDLK
jgi:hypothetical protein